MQPINMRLLLLLIESSLGRPASNSLTQLQLAYRQQEPSSSAQDLA